MKAISLKADCRKKLLVDFQSLFSKKIPNPNKSLAKEGLKNYNQNRVLLVCEILIRPKFPLDYLFEPTSGNLKLNSFDNDLKHSILISINKIELLDAYNPKIEKEDFEVIDLRG